VSSLIHHHNYHPIPLCYKLNSKWRSFSLFSNGPNFIVWCIHQDWCHDWNTDNEDCDTPRHVEATYLHIKWTRILTRYEHSCIYMRWKYDVSAQWIAWGQQKIKCLKLKQVLFSQIMWKWHGNLYIGLQRGYSLSHFPIEVICTSHSFNEYS
jgi:hypothetical protein